MGFGIATAQAERVVAAVHSMQVVGVRITEAGRRALATWARPRCRLTRTICGSVVRHDTHRSVSPSILMYRFGATCRGSAFVGWSKTNGSICLASNSSQLMMPERARCPTRNQSSGKS
jgi:hypothetical protein